MAEKLLLFVDVSPAQWENFSTAQWMKESWWMENWSVLMAWDGSSPNCERNCGEKISGRKIFRQTSLVRIADVMNKLSLNMYALWVGETENEIDFSISFSIFYASFVENSIENFTKRKFRFRRKLQWEKENSRIWILKKIVAFFIDGSHIHLHLLTPLKVDGKMEKVIIAMNFAFHWINKIFFLLKLEG